MLSGQVSPRSRVAPTSLQEQVQCVQRELALRRNVYDRAVNGGRMSREAADREIASMAAVLVTVQAARQVEIAAEAQTAYAEKRRIEKLLASEKREREDQRSYNTAGDIPGSGSEPPAS
jgi:hypothetical protein